MRRGVGGAQLAPLGGGEEAGEVEDDDQRITTFDGRAESSPACPRTSAGGGVTGVEAVGTHIEDLIDDHPAPFAAYIEEEEARLSSAFAGRRRGVAACRPRA
jgi:hypothetical protein